MSKHEELIERLRKQCANTNGRSIEQVLDDFIGNMDAAADALVAQAREIEGLRKDAERYRWLREPSLAAGQGSITVELDDRANGHFSRSIFLAELDATIDAARARLEGKP